MRLPARAPCHVTERERARRRDRVRDDRGARGHRSLAGAHALARQRLEVHRARGPASPQATCPPSARAAAGSRTGAVTRSLERGGSAGTNERAAPDCRSLTSRSIMRSSPPVGARATMAVLGLRAGQAPLEASRRRLDRARERLDRARVESLLFERAAHLVEPLRRRARSAAAASAAPPEGSCPLASASAIAAWDSAICWSWSEARPIRRAVRRLPSPPPPPPGRNSPRGGEERERGRRLPGRRSARRPIFTGPVRRALDGRFRLPGGVDGLRRMASSIPGLAADRLDHVPSARSRPPVTTRWRARRAARSPASSSRPRRLGEHAGARLGRGPPRRRGRGLPGGRRRAANPSLSSDRVSPACIISSACLFPRRRPPRIAGLDPPAAASGFLESRRAVRRARLPARPRRAPPDGRRRNARDRPLRARVSPPAPIARRRVARANGGRMRSIERSISARRSEIASRTAAASPRRRDRWPCRGGEFDVAAAGSPMPIGLVAAARGRSQGPRRVDRPGRESPRPARGRRYKLSASPELLGARRSACLPTPAAWLRARPPSPPPPPPARRQPPLLEPRLRHDRHPPGPVATPLHARARRRR